MGVTRRKYAATPDTAARLETFKQTKLCKFDQLGKCKRGKDCRYAHGTSELLAQPDFQRTRLCKNFNRMGTCVLGAECKFAHGEEELRSLEQVHGTSFGVDVYDEDHSKKDFPFESIEATLDEGMAQDRHEMLAKLLDAVQMRLDRVQAAQQQMKSLQKAQEEQLQIQQMLKQHKNITPQAGLAVPVLIAANGGVMRPILLPTVMMQHAAHDAEAPAPSSPAFVVQQTSQSIMSNRKIECHMQELNRGNVENWKKLLAENAGSQHSTSEDLPHYSDELIANLEQLHCRQRSTDTFSTLPVARTVESLPGLDLGFSRQTTLEGLAPFETFSRQSTLGGDGNRPMERQATPAADFCDSPYCSDFDANSEPGDVKELALETVEEVVAQASEGSACEGMGEPRPGDVQLKYRGQDDEPEVTHPPPADDSRSIKLAGGDGFKLPVFPVYSAFSHFGPTAARRVTSADGRMQH